MDSRQAKEILATYRPGDSTAGNALMIQALELARTDPQLAVWFGQHCAKHVKLPGDAPAFVATVPSTALANRELAAEAAAEAEAALNQKPKQERVISVNKLIIGIVLLIALGFLANYLYDRFTPTPANTFDSYRDRMARLVQRTYPVQLTTTDPAKVREYFRANGGVSDFNLPHNLQKLPALGGAVITWQNQPVSLLGLDGGSVGNLNTNLYLYLIDRSAFTPGTYPATTQYLVIGNVLTATWPDAKTLYLFVGPNDDTLIKNYLAP